MARRSVSPWLTGFMVLVVGALVLAGIYATRPDPPRPLAPEPEPAPVHTRRLEPVGRQRIVRCYGQTVGVREATLACEVTGPVAWRSPALESGTRVAAGEALVRLELDLLRTARESARASLEAARSTVRARENESARAAASIENFQEQAAVARREYDRLKGLADSGEAPASSVDQTQRLLLIAEWNARDAVFAKEAADAALAGSKAAEIQAQAALARAEYDLEHGTLSAPFAGEVSEPRAEIGDWMLPGRIVCRVIDRSTLRIEARIPNEDSIGVLLSTPARVRFPALVGTDGEPLLLPARLIGIEPGARPESRSRTIVATVANEDLRIPAGAFVELLVDAGLETAVWLRPSEFLLRGDVPVAFVVAEGPRADARELGLGRPLVDEAARAWHPVRSGLAGGELLAVDNLEQLAHGVPLELLGDPAPPPAPASEGRPGR